MKKASRMLILTACVLAAAALLWQLNWLPSFHVWWNYTDPEGWAELEDVSLTTESPISSGTPEQEISLTVTNHSGDELYIVCSWVRLQKKSDGGSWMEWVNIPPKKAEVSTESPVTIYPGESYTYSIAPTDLAPRELLRAGSYRVWLPLEHRPAYVETVNVQKDYVTAEITME